MYTQQEEINDGQKRINGALCRVDWKLIKALKELRLAIAAAPGLGRIDFKDVDTALVDAYKASAIVADIKPPGCEPSLTYDPNWTVIPKTTTSGNP